MSGSLRQSIERRQEIEREQQIEQSRLNEFAAENARLAIELEEAQRMAMLRAPDTTLGEIGALERVDDHMLQNFTPQDWHLVSGMGRLEFEDHCRAYGIPLPTEAEYEILTK